jgi:DNA ligase-3
MNSLPNAFNEISDMVLDGEIVVVDKVSGEILPHNIPATTKQIRKQTAQYCLILFDIIRYDGKDLTMQPLIERRKILDKVIKPINNFLQHSEYEVIKRKSDLVTLIKNTFERGQEGLVLKNINSVYEPGQRRWLKIKRNSFDVNSSIADTCDLVVLGGWYGSGNRRRVLVTLMMGCQDPQLKTWKSVAKVSLKTNKKIKKSHRYIAGGLERIFYCDRS